MRFLWQWFEYYRLFPYPSPASLLVSLHIEQALVSLEIESV